MLLEEENTNETNKGLNQMSYKSECYMFLLLFVKKMYLFINWCVTSSYENAQICCIVNITLFSFVVVPTEMFCTMQR